MTPTVIHRLRCTLRDLWHYDGCGCNTCVPVAEVIAAIERELAAKDAEIAELRRDKERLDWIIATDDAHWVTWEDGCTEISLTESEDCFSGASFREAIDKARAEDPK